MSKLFIETNISIFKFSTSKKQFPPRLKGVGSLFTKDKNLSYTGSIISFTLLKSLV